MYFWNSYPFVRLSIILIAGILCFSHYPTLWNHSNLTLASLLFLFAITLLLSQAFGHFQLRLINGIVSLSIFFFVGGDLVKRKYDDLPKNHYSRIQASVNGFSGTISSDATERANHIRYDLDLLSIALQDSLVEATGTIHLYVRKDTAGTAAFNYGDQILVAGKLFSLSKPGNPHEFDFKKYLSLQQVFSQSFVDRKKIQLTGSSPESKILSIAFGVRSQASRIIDKHISDPRESGIAKALILGIKDHLDNEVKESYSAAGAMHVLAVSGLHVGIVYMFLQFLFGKLKVTKKGRVIFSSITITIIWCYALITGLSPSVMRAATMFSIVALGEVNSLKGNVYNSLGLAAFILLLIDPYLIYSVGFQLSFSAVFGIVYLQPKIYRLREFNLWIFDKAWAITSVSIAAQIATLPLTAFYFHQFPTYFLVSNLVVIPAATCMLVLGILMLLLDPLVSALSAAVSFLLSKIIWLANESMMFVQSLPKSLIDWIYISFSELILIYVFVLALIVGLHHRSFKSVTISILFLLGFLGTRLFSIHDQSTIAQLVFYQVNGKTAIDYIEGHQAKLFVDQIAEDDELLDYKVNPNRLASDLQPFYISTMVMDGSETFVVQPPFTYGIIGTTKILFIDSVTFDFQFDNLIQADILILENGSIKSLSWLKEHFQFNHLLIGNKNSRFYSSKMKQQAKSIDLAIHSLLEDGAFILDVRK